MSVLPIVRWPDPRLSQVCAPVTDVVALAGVVRDLFDTMYAAPGRGLAGPQVGLMQRVFVMDPTWKDGDRSPLVCINPDVLHAAEGVAEGAEACLSIPGVSAKVTRPTEITLAYSDLSGVRHQEVLTGFAAICAQHELDHLNGVVIFDRLAPDARARFEAEYAALA
ncbi:MAG: peptide deformylase [Marivita sp.]|uniref:peptide deformylase n=1 Tax=Marivita sp. TaxID=2003365 RepID=UPI003EF43794